jgi:hypothetical protein
MPDVMLASRPGLVARPRTRDVRAAFRSVLRQSATGVAVLAGCLVVLLTPLYIHPALDAAGAPATLGLSAAATHHLSDLTVSELVFGPGDFAFAAPDGARFFDTSEASHMRDARTVLLAFLAIAAASVAFLVASMRGGPRHGAARRAEAWRHVSRGAAVLVVSVVALAVFALVAFDTAFELFHRVFFPGGNYSFDPGTQRLVQLYPLPFWRITATAFASLAVSGGILVWWVARRRARHHEGAEILSPRSHESSA